MRRLSLCLWLIALPLFGFAQDIKEIVTPPEKAADDTKKAPDVVTIDPKKEPEPEPGAVPAKFHTVKRVALAKEQPVRFTPAEVRVKPGRLASVVIQHDGDDVKWMGSEELDQFREYDPDPKKIRLRILAGDKKGKYRLTAISCKEGKLSDFYHCDIIVDDKPGPGPGPEPEPEPNDPLHQPLLAAFYAENAADKADIKSRLADFYEEAASAAKDQTYKTWGALFGAMKSASQSPSVNVFGKLTAVQKVLQEEMGKVLPADGTRALDAAGRETAANLFLRFAKVLREVK